MFQNVKGMIFDFDGTLINSLKLWQEVDVEFLRARGIACPDNLQQDIEGMGLQDCARYFQERFSLTDSVESMISEWSDMVREKYFHLSWKEGSEKFLQYAKDVDYPMAMATSNQEDLVSKVLGHRGLSHIFSAIATSDYVGAAKPEPDVFLEAARRIGVRAEDCLVFEDTYAGVEGAKRAGMRAVAVYNGHMGNWEAIQSLADHHIYEYHSLLETLRDYHE